jgi:hypothetical protein
MRRTPDIGGFFEQLTRRAPGGRRLREVVDAGRRTTRRAGARVRSRRRDADRRRVSPSPESVVIDYAPRLDGDPDPGEVVWAWVPFEEDPTRGKDRPVVVIGRRGRGLVGVPLTTRRDEREAQVALGVGDWDGDRRPSYARIWRLLDLDADRMRREGAVLDRDRFDAVVAAVDRYYEVRRPPTV